MIPINLLLGYFSDDQSRARRLRRGGAKPQAATDGRACPCQN
jgi:hypothetical protein